MSNDQNNSVTSNMNDTATNRGRVAHNSAEALPTGLINITDATTVQAGVGVDADNSISRSSPPMPQPNTPNDVEGAQALLMRRYPQKSQGPIASPLAQTRCSNEGDQVEYQFSSRTNSADGHLPRPRCSIPRSVPQESHNSQQRDLEAAEALMMMRHSEPHGPVGGSIKKEDGEIAIQSTAKNVGGQSKKDQDAEEAKKTTRQEISREQRERLIRSGATQRGRDYLY